MAFPGEAVRIWFKALSIFWLGFLAASYALTVVGMAVAKAKGVSGSPYWLSISMIATLLAIGAFLIFWGWFRFRSKNGMESLEWYELFFGGFLVLPLLATIGTALKLAGILNLMPSIFEIVLPPLTLLLVAEASVFKVRQRAKLRAEEAAASAPEEKAPQA